MARVVDFRTLVKRAARRAAAKTEPPRPLRLVAEDCGVCRQHLYNLMTGTQQASPWVVERIAAGLGLSVDTVTRALRVSRERAEVLK